MSGPSFTGLSTITQQARALLDAGRRLCDVPEHDACEHVHLAKVSGNLDLLLAALRAGVQGPPDVTVPPELRQCLVGLWRAAHKVGECLRAGGGAGRPSAACLDRLGEATRALDPWEQSPAAHAGGENPSSDTPAGGGPAAAGTDTPPAEDGSAYLPAKQFLDGQRFRTHKRLRAALKRNPWIRTRKPSPQRLEVHAGDWGRYRAMLDAAGFDALDVSAETADAYLAEVRRRQEEIRRRAAGK